MRSSPISRAAPPGAALLGSYLRDHLAALTAQARLGHRLAGAHRRGDDAALLREFAQELDVDRTAMRTVMQELEVPVRRYKQLSAAAAELVGRAKLNGRLVRRSPLSDLLELEALSAALAGKAVLWRTLRDRVRDHPRLDAAWLDSLVERALTQRELVEHLRVRAANQVLGDARQPEVAQ